LLDLVAVGGRAEDRMGVRDFTARAICCVRLIDDRSASVLLKADNHSGLRGFWQKLFTTEKIEGYFYLIIIGNEILDLNVLY
jgi:hypothetical protein